MGFTVEMLKRGFIPKTLKGCETAIKELIKENKDLSYTIKLQSEIIEHLEGGEIK